ncbi:S8 family peptidase [Xanthomonas euvesicatoria]|uniref:S8 family peptidase n=1 Tax=Xanthomonas euvesicatoria TaxID=456327 RepID=UPI0032199616
MELGLVMPGVIDQQRQAGWEEGLGLRVVFASFPDVHLAIDSLDLKSEGIELLNVRETLGGTLATVWLPEGKLELFEQKIISYLAAPGTGNPRDGRKLLDAIRQIRAAVIEDLWTDDSPIPVVDRVANFEAWIGTPVIQEEARRGRRSALRLTPMQRIARFRAAAELVGLRVGQRPLLFPERAVLQVRGTLAQFQQSAPLLGQLAELRFAPEVAEFFMGLDAAEQREWVDELLGRTGFAGPGEDVPHVCVLDTGCAHGHPLLARSISPDDVHAVDPDWGTGDENGHGTGQCGLALWGDLTGALGGEGVWGVRHRLESVKLLPDRGTNNEDHFGPITAQAVSLPEIHAPHRRRLFSMAVTSDTHVMTGRPTAWSAEVDALCSDWSGNGESPRLMIVSGGNVSGIRPGTYFAANSAASIEDPANAWNALTVGAITRKTNITEGFAGEYVPVADFGGLSPYSSTSERWQREAPFKPEVVFEGGNVGNDGLWCSPLDSLSLLTTHHRPIERQFATTWATSSATAIASRFSAEIMAHYPAFWPETVRALMVHSAQWTERLVQQFPGGRDNIERRLRHCGWGEPDLATAINSGADSLTLIAQSELQPYERNAIRRNVTARDMHLHRMPWPRDILQGLLRQDVELRVSLSYFIEPNPGERGRSDRFRYASHGLRFAVQRPTETAVQFQSRINALSREDDEAFENFEGADHRWLLGPRKRFRGSLHHDRMTCSAPELASREHIAVFPVGGWWKSREALERFERRARYALVVSIHAPDLPSHIDLYTSVEQALQAEIQITVPIEGA